MATENTAVKDETVVSASEVQDRLGDVLDRAMTGERFRVTRHGRERAVILGIEAYERLRKIEQQKNEQDRDAAVA